jgi:hypothetical protein
MRWSPLLDGEELERPDLTREWLASPALLTGATGVALALQRVEVRRHLLRRDRRIALGGPVIA